MKMRASPVGVYVKFARPDAIAGMEVAYSAAKKDGKVRYRAAGAAGRKGFQKFDVDDAKFLADHRHPVTQWGMGPIVELIATATAREKTLNNPVEVFTADYQFANRNVTKYEIFTKRQHAFRYAAKMVVFIDKETKLPGAIRSLRRAQGRRDDRRVARGVQLQRSQVQLRHRRERLRLLTWRAGGVSPPRLRQ